MELIKDVQGFETVLLRKEVLRDFQALVKTLRDKKYGATTGVVKLRLHHGDRNDDGLLQALTTHLKRVFLETVLEKSKPRRLLKSTQERKFAYSPKLQNTLKAAIEEDIYEYVEKKSSLSQRQAFVREAVNVDWYRVTNNCCTDALGDGMHHATAHFFDILRRKSQYTATLRAQWDEGQSSTPARTDATLYGGDIDYDDAHCSAKIGGVLDLCKLGTIIDSLPQRYDGIHLPVMHCGTKHSFFPWHIEDMALCNINYLVAGASKIWYIIEPRFFGLVDCIAQGFPINRSHSQCRALLVNHKAIVFDPEYTKQKFGIPYVSVQQDPGDIIIVWPWALHITHNAGNNLAISVNFADVEWLKDAIYAPVCGCKEDVVHMDLIPLLRIHKPDLLQKYQQAPWGPFPEHHPRVVVKVLPESFPRLTSHQRIGRKKKMYICPETRCNTSYEDHKERLRSHILSQHQARSRQLLADMESKYPTVTPKLARKRKCPVCGVEKGGSITHLRRHMVSQMKNRNISSPMLRRYKEELLKIQQ